ncbi:TonB-dependent receptor plug domain-containing protein [Vibrio makurazakiensis]|uniref:TonB-dependent receptor plug domain-containing protein n=1 Tax=Vibrio makurazakiensis TaxID=2910250 RepID=UPI003D138629
MKLHPLIFVTAISTSSVAQSEQAPLDLLMSMSLEELTMLDIEMGTANKSNQKLTDIPSSVYVLSNERIQRSGARTIAEALMLVPGLKVTKFSETEWFVSARGFHDGLYNKMLVMMDGRSLFSPVYGGTYWSNVDYILADIERIEVLKGPGGTIWGGNAVNGVVNIITKSTNETLGTYVSGLTSGSSNYELSVRQGVQLNDNVTSKAFYKKKNEPRHTDYNDIWQSETAGVAIENQQDDWAIRFGGYKSSYTTEWWTLEYDNGLYTDINKSQFEPSSESYYIQLTANDTVTESISSQYSIWAEYNDETAKDAPGTYKTIDLDATFYQRLSENHNLTYGGGARLITLDFSSSQNQDLNLDNMSYYARAYEIEKTNDEILNIFIQSDKGLTDSISMTAGLKLEHFTQNNSTELSPQIRFMYQYSPQSSFWTGIGRSVASPSYMDSDSTYYQTYTYCPVGSLTCNVNNPEYYIAQYSGGDDLDNEAVVTAELGYRFQSESSFEVDLTTFISQHSHVRQHDYSYQDQDHKQVYVYKLSGDYTVDTYGAEIGATYMLVENITSYVSYSYLSVDAKHNEGSLANAETAKNMGIESEQISTAQIMWNISNELQIDLIGKYHNINYPEPLEQFDSQLAFDARLGWKKNSSAPLFEVVVENIGQHDGYKTDWSTWESVNEESVYVRVSHEF